MPTALVTGASRGVGRGVAISLANSGFQVFATGRSIDTADLPASVVRLPCDHQRDPETAAAFTRVAAETGTLDLLVNSAWGGYEKWWKMADSPGHFHSGNSRPPLDLHAGSRRARRLCRIVACSQDDAATASRTHRKHQLFGPLRNTSATSSTASQKPPPIK